MPAAADSPSTGSSPGVGFSTPQAGRDLIHAAQLEQLKAQLGQLDESFPGFGSELQASLPGLPEDSSLLKRSRRELASLAMRLCSFQLRGPERLPPFFRLCAGILVYKGGFLLE